MSKQNKQDMAEQNPVTAKLDDLSEANNCIRKLRAALRSMQDWDCQDDALKDAYEQANGKGSWEALFS